MVESGPDPPRRAARGQDTGAPKPRPPHAAGVRRLHKRPSRDARKADSRLNAASTARFTPSHAKTQGLVPERGSGWKCASQQVVAEYHGTRKDLKLFAVLSRRRPLPAEIAGQQLHRIDVAGLAPATEFRDIDTPVARLAVVHPRLRPAAGRRLAAGGHGQWLFTVLRGEKRACQPHRSPDQTSEETRGHRIHRARFRRVPAWARSPSR